MNNILTKCTIGLAMMVAAYVPAQNTLVSGDLTVGANWDTGAPTSVGNIGIIDSDNTGATQGLVPADGSTKVEDLFIRQTGGVVVRAGSSNSFFNNTEYELAGGQLSVRNITVENGSTFLISGGDFATSLGGNLTLTSSSFTITSGSMTSVSNLNSRGGTFDIQGGTVTAGGNFSYITGTTTVDFSGNSSTEITSAMGSTNTGVFGYTNIGLGSGTISAGTFNVSNASRSNLDWTSGSEFSFTATSINSASGASSWSELWDLGILTVDGGQTGTFASNFFVDGGTNTLTLIPEPSSIALLGLAGVAFCMLRRRR